MKGPSLIQKNQTNKNFQVWIGKSSARILAPICAMGRKSRELISQIGQVMSPEDPPSVDSTWSHGHWVPHLRHRLIWQKLLSPFYRRGIRSLFIHSFSQEIVWRVYHGFESVNQTIKSLSWEGHILGGMAGIGMSILTEPTLLTPWF